MLRWIIGILIGIFILPFFLGAGMIGGCFLALAAEGTPGGGGDYIFIAPIIICGLAGLAVTVLIARAIRV
jgi:hypothetical protein